MTFTRPRAAPKSFELIVDSSCDLEIEFQNLTKMQKNNIIRKRSRFADSRYLTAYDMIFMRNYFNDFDQKLLAAAAEGDAIGMMRAILEGADVNAQEPGTGHTALHKLAPTLNIFCVDVLFYREDGYQELIKGLEAETDIDLEMADQRLREGMARLNPLIVDNEGYWPRDMLGVSSCDLPEGFLENLDNPEFEYDDPLWEMRNIMDTRLHYIQQEALIKNEYNPKDFFWNAIDEPIDDRLKRFAGHAEPCP